MIVLLTGKTSTSSRNRLDTDTSASWGHSWNQFIAVQLMMAGNFRARIRKVDPTGEKHSTTLSWRRTRSMKNFQQFSRVSSIPAPFTCDGSKRVVQLVNMHSWDLLLCSFTLCKVTKQIQPIPQHNTYFYDIIWHHQQLRIWSICWPSPLSSNSLFKTFPWQCHNICISNRIME